jgi:hypothetical protein
VILGGYKMDDVSKNRMLTNVSLPFFKNALQIVEGNYVGYCNPTRTLIKTTRPSF